MAAKKSQKPWETKPLKSVAKRFVDFRGRTPKKLGMAWGGGHIPALSANNVVKGAIDFSKECYFASEALYSKWMTQGDTEEGDIVITLEAPLGNVARIPDDRKYVLSQRVVLIKPDDDLVDRDFLFHQLMGEQFQSILVTNATGTTAKGIRQAYLAELPVTVPPLCSQKRIAAILNTVDDAIEATRAVIEQTRKLKTALLQDLLTNGLPRKRKSASTHPKHGPYPNGWKFRTLSDVCTRINDGVHQSVKAVKNGVPFLYVSCVRDESILWDEAARISKATYFEISRNREPEVGGVLYTVVRSYGHAAIVPDDREFSFQRHIAYLIPNRGLVLPEFLCLWMNGPFAKCHADRVALGNAQKTITLGELGEFPICLPDVEEQNKVVSAIQTVTNRMRLNQLRLNALRDCKEALSQGLLTGRVPVEGRCNG